MNTPQVAALAGMTPLGIAPTVTLTLTADQARLVKAALNAEIIKGSSTFLSGRDVLNLGRVADSIIDQLSAIEETV